MELYCSTKNSPSGCLFPPGLNVPDKWNSCAIINKEWLENPFQLSELAVHPKIRISRRSAYIMGLINKTKFLNIGAKPLLNGVYFIQKEYKGTAHYETSALLGFEIDKLFELIRHNNPLIPHLRSHPDLQYIPGIEKLSASWIVDTVIKFQQQLLNHSNELVLLNIEPMGAGRLKRCYPEARITVPGGTMDDIDGYSFEMCGLREFREETGLDIAECHRELSRHKIKKFKKKKWTKFSYSEEQTQSISMFFLVKIY